MNNITKKLLLGYIFIILLGGGCFGFIFINFFDDINSIVTAICATSFLLLIAYLVLTIIIVHFRKKLPQGIQSTKQFLISFFILLLVTVILAVLFFMFRNSILVFFNEQPKVLRSVISVLFLMSITIGIYQWFKTRR